MILEVQKLAFLKCLSALNLDLHKIAQFEIAKIDKNQNSEPPKLSKNNF